MVRMREEEEEYEDSYGTCVETYSTLRIFSDEMGPEEIGHILRMEGNDKSFRRVMCMQEEG